MGIGIGVGGGLSLLRSGGAGVPGQLRGRLTGRGELTGALTQVHVMAGALAGAGVLAAQPTQRHRLAGSLSGAGVLAGAATTGFSSPLSFGDDLTVWFDASDDAVLFEEHTGASATTPSSEDGVVKTWLDKSGNGRHAVTDSGDSGYTKRAGGWIENVGGEHIFQAPAAIAPGNGDLTIVAGYEMTANGFWPGVLWPDGGTAGIGLLHYNTQRKPYGWIVGGTAGTLNLNDLVASLPALTVGAKTVVTLEWNSTGRLSIRRDGVQVGVLTNAGGTFGTPSAYELLGITGFTTPIKMAQFMVVKTLLNSAERADAEAYVADKMGVSLTPTAFGALALGDSTVAAYAGGDEILSFITSSWTKVDVADPGDTVAGQKTAFLASAYKDTAKWAVIQIGHNDVDPAASAGTVIAGIQDLVDTVRLYVPADCKVLVAKMTPARQRYIDLHGATDGATVYAQWQDVNEAIAGAGASPITGVDGRVTSHADDLNDGSGNLDAAYDTGDSIHVNNTGRAIVAAAWETALTAAGATI